MTQTISMTGRVFFEEEAWHLKLNEINQMTFGPTLDDVLKDCAEVVREYFEACKVVGTMYETELKRLGVTVPLEGLTINVTLNLDAAIPCTDAVQRIAFSVAA